MKKFEKEAAKVLEVAFGFNQRKIQANPAIFSYDNVNLHVGGDEVVGPSGTPNHIILPRYSPDMHKVIEHVFNTVSHELRVNILPAVAADHKRHPYSLSVWPALVEGEVMKVSTESIRKDIDSLPKTYRWIYEHGGRRAPRPYN